MPIIRFVFTFFFSLIISFAFAQRPSEVMYFFNKTDRACINNITLSSDSIYFYTGICEDDAAVAKGKWKINNDTLTLTNFDRKDCWPHYAVTAKEYTSPDSVHVSITDYFGKPFHDMRITFFDSAGKEYYEFADSNGLITLPRDHAVNYYFTLMNADSAMHKADSLAGVVKQGMNDIAIVIDYPSSTRLGYELHPIDFERLTFIISDGMLYDETGKVVYDNRYFIEGITPVKPDQKAAPKTKVKK